MYTFEDYVNKAAEANAQNKKLYVLKKAELNENGENDRELVIAEPDYFLCEEGTNVTRGEVNSQYEELKKAEQLNALRRKRENDCFTVVNRGKVWYDTLTVAQLDELKAWYGAWLDVTETLREPEYPEWL